MNLVHEGAWVLAIMSLTTCVDRTILAHDRATGTGDFKGCVCTPKEAP